MLESLTSFSSN